jgi:hypothetical protein
MTALAAAAQRPSRNLGKKIRVPLNAASQVYAGSLVMIDSDGYGRPAAALASNGGCIGVATEDKLGGAADGDEYVTVQEGEFLFTGTTLAQSVLATGKVYAEDDNTVDETQGSNEPLAGIVTEFVSATQAWVHVSNANRLT